MTNSFSTPCPACLQWSCDQNCARSQAKKVSAPVQQEQLTDDIVRGWVVSYLLEADLPNSAAVGNQIGTAIASLDIPDLEYIKQAIEQCQRSEGEIIALINQQLAGSGIPSPDVINALAKQVATACFADMISGYCTKAEITALIEKYFNDLNDYSEAEVRAFAKIEALACIQAYPFNELVAQALLNSGFQNISQIEAISKGQAESCFQSLITEYCTKKEIEMLIAVQLAGLADFSEIQIRAFAKDEAQDCIDAYPFEQLVSDAISNAGIPTTTNIEQIAKAQAQDCVNAAQIPTQQLIEAYAKAVALTCINDALQGDYRPTQEELVTLIKATTFDCLKELLDESPGAPADGNTRVTGLGVTCDDTGLLRFQVLQSDNTVIQQEADLSKFFGGVQNTLTGFNAVCDDDGVLRLSIEQSNGPDLSASASVNKGTDPVDATPVSVCFSYGGATYSQDPTTGKITLQDDLKVERYNGGFEQVPYSQALDCRVIPYTGPTEAEIGFMISTAIAEIDPGDGGLTEAQVETLIQSYASTFCVTGIQFTGPDANGLVTMQLTDQCGTRTGSFVVPNSGGGTNGIDAAQAKLIANQCIQDEVKDIVLACIADEVGDVEATIAQYIQDNVTILSAADVNNQIQQYITTNQSQFCNLSISSSFNDATRELTTTITDQCGSLSTTEVIPGGTVGGTGITATEAKSIAQGCIDDAANNSRFCLDDVTTTLIGTTLQIAVTDDCGTQVATQDLSSLIQSYCINNLQLSYAGSTLGLTVGQDNCPLTSASINLPIDGTGNTVECCNTNFSTPDFDPDTGIATVTLNQSNGDPVEFEFDLCSWFNTVDEIGDDGCSEYSVLRIGNKELFRVDKPTGKTCCLTYCVTYTEVTDEAMTFNTASGMTWEWYREEDGTTGQRTSGNGGTTNQTFQPGTYSFTVCQNNACERAEAPEFASGLPTSKQDCGCGC